MTKLVLYDVDQTLIIKKSIKIDGVETKFYGINKNLIEAKLSEPKDLFKKEDKQETKDLVEGKNQVKADCYLFSNMSLTDMDNIPTPQGSLNFITRLTLSLYMEDKNDVNFLGVMTQADVAYEKGVGATYRYFYLPAHKACTNDPKAYEKNKREPGSFNQQYTALLNKLDKIVTDQLQQGELLKRLDTKLLCELDPSLLMQIKENKLEKETKAAIQKTLMFEYLMQASNGKYTEVEYYDDDDRCLKIIRALASAMKIKIVTHQITKQEALPLSIPEESAFAMIVAAVKKQEGSAKKVEEPESKPTFSLFLPKLTKSNLKKIAYDELKQIELWYEHIPAFKTQIDLAIKKVGESSDFGNFCQTIRKKLQGTTNNASGKLEDMDPAAARRKIITLIAASVEFDSELYKKITGKQFGANQVGFSAACNDKPIFEYFPELIEKFLPNNGGELNKIVAAMHETATKKLGGLEENLANRMVKEKSGSDSVKSFIEDNKLPESDFFSLSFWNASEKRGNLLTVIKRITPILLECDKFFEEEMKQTSAATTIFNEKTHH